MKDQVAQVRCLLRRFRVCPVLAITSSVTISPCLVSDPEFRRSRIWSQQKVCEFQFGSHRGEKGTRIEYSGVKKCVVKEVPPYSSKVVLRRVLLSFPNFFFFFFQSQPGREPNTVT